MKNPLISVIVPIYNTERYTGQCIESIINQTYANLEIILVDDGSSDRCSEICDLYALKDSRIKVIHKINGGLVAARKTGVTNALGEYIGYVDGDDLIASGYYEAMAHTIENTSADVVIAGWTRVFFEQHVKINNSLPCGVYAGTSLEDVKHNMISFGDFFKNGISTYVWNKVFRKEIIYDCQLSVNEKLMIGEDACVTYPSILKSSTIAVIDNYDYNYRQHEDSMLKRKPNYSLELDKLNALHDNLIAFTGNDSVLRQQADDYLLSCCIVRSGGVLPDNKTFVFGPDFTDKRIVVYSAGTFGQALVSKLSEQNNCKLVGWLDDDYWEYRRCCLDVDPISEIQNKDFDYVIIASVSHDYSEEISDKLADLGITKDKMVYITADENERNSLLKSYLSGI